MNLEHFSYRVILLLAFTASARADCLNGLTAEIQNLNMKAAIAKLSGFQECLAPAERMQFYGGAFPKEVPEKERAENLIDRCKLTDVVLSDAVMSCDEAKKQINLIEISQKLEEEMPTMLARVVSELPPGAATASSSLATAPELEGQAQPMLENIEHTTFIKRFLDSYRAPAPVTASAPAQVPNDLPDAPSFRGYPAVLDSPPFPNSVFPYGGTSTIGQPNPAVGTPLMNGLHGTAVGTKLEHFRINIYGWVNGGGNLSTSHSGGYANAPIAYAQRANTVQLDQAAIFIERVPDTVQNTHFDWGFRVTNVYGLDYRFTTAKGFLSSQLIDHNHENGFDIPMAYVDLYFPVKDGLNVRIGRFISVPDIEAQLAPSNYNYTHSQMYDVDAYTQTGVIASLKLNQHWLVQAGLTAGNDVMPWTKGDAQPTGVVCLNYTWKEGKQNIYVCDNSINPGNYAYNNMNQYNATYSIKVSKKIHTATEVYYLREKNVPAVGGPISAEANSNPAFCKPGQIKCTTGEVGMVNYTQRQLGKTSYLSFRNGFLSDPEGQRTGHATQYQETLVNYTRTFLNNRLVLRPEFGFEHSYSGPAFDNGTKKNQTWFASDFILNF